MNPVVAEVHPHEGEPPGPGRVPGQLHQMVLVPHIHVSRQLTASHQQAGGDNQTCVSVERQTLLVMTQSSVRRVGVSIILHTAPIHLSNIEGSLCVA